jgi:hypothetical protein
MTNRRKLLILASLLGTTAQAPGRPGPPSNVPPIQVPPRGRPPVFVPAPLLGAGLPAIVAAGAAIAGYRLWRRRRQPSEDK